MQLDLCWTIEVKHPVNIKISEIESYRSKKRKSNPLLGTKYDSIENTHYSHYN